MANELVSNGEHFQNQPMRGADACASPARSQDHHQAIARPRVGPVQMLLLAMVSVLPACATAPLVSGVGLSSYDHMTPSDGMITKSRIKLNKEQVLSAKTINIQQTAFSPEASPKLSGQQRELVANAVSRALCVNLSDRFTVVQPYEQSDLTVRASITQATPTDEIAAGASAAASLGLNFVDMGTSIPIPTPRVPLGLGTLSVEAEAVDWQGQQQASMLWARGATVFFSNPKASKASDAYDLAAAFGEDFGSFLVKGKSPFGGSGIDINLPSWHKIESSMGFAPKYAACENYGRSPGIARLIGDKVGLPPEWTDGGPRRVAGQ